MEIVNYFKSISHYIIGSKLSLNIFSDYPSKPNGELVKCSNCGRGFAKERIDKHIQICTNHKERKIYDIAQARVEGTEAGELYKAGKI